MMNKIRLIVSACLRGRCCRYDGKSKPYFSIGSNDDFEWIEICPEFLAFGGEHEPANRVGDLFIRRESKLDCSKEFYLGVEMAQRYISDACGAVLKSKSPSCGYFTTPIYKTDGSIDHTGSGIWAEYLAKLGMPIIDEYDFSDPTKQLDFVTKCRRYRNSLDEHADEQG